MHEYDWKAQYLYFIRFQSHVERASRRVWQVALQYRYPLAEFRCRFIERLDTRTKVIKKFVSSSFNC